MARQAALKPGAAIQRVGGLDALRGLAVIAMVAYHFAFDLAYFRVTAQDFYRDAFWLHSRTAILSSFLLIAGVSLVLAQRTAQGRAGFWIHLGRVAACALAVTAGSFFMFPRSFIWFGVLHAIAASLLLIRPLAGRPCDRARPRHRHRARRQFVRIARVRLARARLDRFHDEQADHRGLRAALPWTGVMLIGVAAGHALARRTLPWFDRSRDFPRSCTGWDATAWRSTWCINRFCSVHSGLPQRGWSRAIIDDSSEARSSAG